MGPLVRTLLLSSIVLLACPWARAEEAPGSGGAPPAPTGGPAPAPTAGAEAGEPPLLTTERAPGVALEGQVSGPRPVIGREPTRALRTVPGSGSSVTQEEILRQREVISVQEVVRTLPGVVVRSEAASGILPNIGVRGLNPDRSEKLLVLQDGVPAGMAPYVENASYYMPPFERMQRIELLKGSGSILYGPHTVGGVLNLMTPDIPACLSGRVRTVAGTDGYLMGYLQAGQTVGPWGWLVTGLAKRGDGWRDESSFDLHDLTAKVRWRPSSCTSVTLRVSTYRQDSQDTYLGLTPALFDADPYQNPVRHDALEVENDDLQLTVQQRLSSCWELLTNLYASQTRRDWNRQDFARNTGFAAAPANTVATVGDLTVDGGAIFLRASYGSRDRDFEKWGVEPRLIGTHALLGRKAELHLGARFHQEEMTDERNNRSSLHADPVTRDRDVRSVDAWAFFAQEKLQLSARLGLSLGLRVESYDQERHVQVASGAPVDVRGTSGSTEWIPGAGLTYEVARETTAFFGVHRGFSPPRVAQAITSTGTDRELEAERSWEYELGLRGRATPCGCPWLSYELAGFYYDFDNQVVPANQSGGASTADTNAGQTRHLGFETALTVDATRLLTGRCDGCRTAVYVDLGWTWLDTENVTPGGTFEGRALPYAPENVAWAGLRVVTPAGLSLGLLGHFTGEQFSDQANTVAPSADGLVGRIDSRFVVDLTLRWRIPRTAFTATLAVNNLFDEVYVASRAPEGTFPGAPRHGFLGLEAEF